MKGFDTSGDGFTGEKQDLNCWACGTPMVSLEYILCGKRLWTTIHPQCADRASEMLHASRNPYNATRRKQKPVSSNQGIRADLFG
jgi:hypothetical protein